MTIRELTDSVQGNKVLIIELSGEEAKKAYRKRANLGKNLDSSGLAYVCGYGIKFSDETCEVYQVINSAVHLTMKDDSSRPELSELTTIKIINSNPAYQQESLLRLEQIFEMRLRHGGRPVIRAIA